MRYLILSDIHGSATYLEKMMNLFEKGSFDFILLLGDILYHGPRNQLPEGYNPQEVVRMLNEHKEQIIACRGNCEAEVDQMLLEFPCLGDYALVVDDGVKLFATHGHKYTWDNFPNASGKQVFLYGHTHLWEARKEGDLLICNPGSVSLPKENREHTYATYENGTLSIYNFEHECLTSVSF